MCLPIAPMSLQPVLEAFRTRFRRADWMFCLLVVLATALILFAIAITGAYVLIVNARIRRGS